MGVDLFLYHIRIYASQSDVTLMFPNCFID